MAGEYRVVIDDKGDEGALQIAYDCEKSNGSCWRKK